MNRKKKTLKKTKRTPAKTEKKLQAQTKTIQAHIRSRGKRQQAKRDSR